MSSPSSDDRPIIKSRTGKFLQGLLGKTEDQDQEKTAAAGVGEGWEDTPSEFLQRVPDPIAWDDTEESNWDDDFVEAPPAPFTSAVGQPQAVTSAPEPFGIAVPEGIATPPVVPPPPPPRPAVAATPEVKPESPADSGPVEVNIPRPKNIKYRNRPPESEAGPVPGLPMDGDNSQPLELNIKRPTNIKYKAKPPEPEPPQGPIDRLKAFGGKLIQSFWGSLRERWQLPAFKLGDRQQLLAIVGAAFLALTVAWATINFWPQGGDNVATAPNPVSPPPLPPRSSFADQEPLPDRVTTPATTTPAAPTATIAVAPTVEAPPPAPVVAAKPSPLPSPVTVAPTPPSPPPVAATPAPATPLEVLASQYAPGFIRQLQLAPEQQLARVVVGNQWYALAPEQQQQAAQNLWQQVVTYGTPRLEVVDSQQQLVARSPVVGGEAIVLD
jgi:hypothetical protein